MLRRYKLVTASPARGRTRPGRQKQLEVGVGWGKKVLKTSPVGYVAVKAAESRKVQQDGQEPLESEGWQPIDDASGHDAPPKDGKLAKTEAREARREKREERLVKARRDLEEKRGGGAVAPLVQSLDKRGEKLLKGNLHQDEEVLVKLQGDFGQAFVVTDKRIYCVKWGFMTDQTFGGRCTAFEHGTTSGVQITKHMTTALLEVITPGNQDKKLSYWGGRNSGNNAKTADNAVTFPTTRFALFQRAVNVAREQISVSHAPAAAVAVSTTDVPDQIRKLADLRDQGILTDDEFQTKKTQLLERL